MLRLLRRRRRRGVRIVARTATYARSTPRVTVALALAHNRSDGSVDALASVAASRYRELELELLILTASGDRSTPAMRRFLKDHPALPALLLHQPVDQGLAHARNTLAKRARGEYIIFLDAHAGIYPTTLERLVTALDADPQAAFSYPMVAAFAGTRPVELLSSLPWEPERLKRGNWIDGVALIRRALLLELGGYTTDPSLAGWEDFYLWCKLADASVHGVHVPQVLAWRQQTANTDTPAKWALMRELFPRLLASTS
jgi:glycosyltransferase involved in cell wall biosynthesis